MDLSLLRDAIKAEEHIHIYPSKATDGCFQVFIDNLPEGFDYASEGQPDRHVLRVRDGFGMAIWLPERLGKSDAAKKFRQLIAPYVKNDKNEHGSHLKDDVSVDKVMDVLREVAAIANAHASTAH